MTPPLTVPSPARLRFCALLLLLTPALLGAQTTRPRPAVPPIVAGCPFAATLPAGWQRVPPLTARVNSARHMRLTYGAGPEDLVFINVNFRGNMMARMEQQGLVSNNLMVSAPPLTFAGKPANVWRSVKNADALAGRGGNDVWHLYVAWDDERYAVVSIVAQAAKGKVPPTDATIRALLGTFVPGACLNEDEPL